MTERVTGWTFVAAQAALIVALALVPSADHYPTPNWLNRAADVIFWAGVVLAVIAGAYLGRALTATPVPTAAAKLKTTGPYRWVRHPIYTGVILIVVAMAIRTGNVIGVLLGALTIVFFDRKAAWEEQRLNARFDDYAHYAAHTPRFLPRPW